MSVAKKRARLIKALVSIAFFAFLLRFVGTRDLVSILKQIDPFYFVLSLLLAVVMVGSSCLKWRVSLRLVDTAVPLSRLSGIYLIGYYFSNLLPTNIGGDVVRSYYLGRSIGSQSRAAASVVIERFSGMLFLLFLAAVAPAFRPRLYASPYIVAPAAGAIGLLVLFMSFACVSQPVARLRRLLGRVLAALRLPGQVRLLRWADRLLGPVERVYEKLVQAVGLARRDRSALLQLVGLTVWFYILTWLNVYLAFRTFGATPGFFDVAAVTPSIMIVSMIPISAGSLGLAEGAYVFYFSMIGMEPALALAVGLFMRFKVLLVGVVGFFFYLAHSAEGDRAAMRAAAPE